MKREEVGKIGVVWYIHSMLLCITRKTRFFAFASAAALVLGLFFAACDTGYEPAGNETTQPENPLPGTGPSPENPAPGTVPSPDSIGPRTEQADAAARRILELLLSDIEFDFGAFDKSALTGIPVSFSCIVDTDDTPEIAEIEASIKKGCGEWGNTGDKGIAAGGGIAVFIITNGTGSLRTDDVVQWAQSQTNLKSSMNTYAAESPQAQELQQIIDERCSGSTVEEKVRSVNRLLFNWLWYNSGGQRDAYTVLHGARASGAWGTQCDGYARSMVALLRTWGVKARYISGYAITYNGGSGSGAHAWVQVWNGSEWRMVDPTWNDPVVSQQELEMSPWLEDQIQTYYLNRWMMIKTINGDRVITNEGGDYGPGSPKFHNARL